MWSPFKNDIKIAFVLAVNGQTENTVTLIAHPKILSLQACVRTIIQVPQEPTFSY